MAGQAIRIAAAVVPLVVGAGGGPRTFAWIAQHADGWMTTPGEQDVADKVVALRKAWAEAGRDGEPQLHVLATSKPTPELLPPPLNRL